MVQFTGQAKVIPPVWITQLDENEITSKPFVTAGNNLVSNNDKLLSNVERHPCFRLCLDVTNQTGICTSNHHLRPSAHQPVDNSYSA